MKYFFAFSFVLISCLGFSQEENKQNNSQPSTTRSIKRLDEIRQGQLIISTENINKSITIESIDIRPSLDIEVQKIMFTGNFRNPRDRNVIIKH